MLQVKDKQFRLLSIVSLLIRGVHCILIYDSSLLKFVRDKWRFCRRQLDFFSENIAKSRPQQNTECHFIIFDSQFFNIYNKHLQSKLRFYQPYELYLLLQLQCSDILTSIPIHVHLCKIAISKSLAKQALFTITRYTQQHCFTFYTQFLYTICRLLLSSNVSITNQTVYHFLSQGQVVKQKHWKYSIGEI